MDPLGKWSSQKWSPSWNPTGRSLRSVSWSRSSSLEGEISGGCGWLVGIQPKEFVQIAKVVGPKSKKQKPRWWNRLRGVEFISGVREGVDSWCVLCTSQASEERSVGFAHMSWPAGFPLFLAVPFGHLPCDATLISAGWMAPPDLPEGPGNSSLTSGSSTRHRIWNTRWEHTTSLVGRTKHDRKRWKQKAERWDGFLAHISTPYKRFSDSVSYNFLVHASKHNYGFCGHPEISASGDRLLFAAILQTTIRWRAVRLVRARVA